MGQREREAASQSVKLQFTQQALGDIIRLREFIAEKNPDAASRISAQLTAHIHRLVDQPLLGHSLDELPDVFEWVARDYVVHYIVSVDTLIVLQIWHGKEDRVP